MSTTRKRIPFRTVCQPLEVDKLVVLHLTGLDEPFTDELEGDHAKDGKEDKDDEEGVTGEEDVGRLNVRLETDTLDTVEHESLSCSLDLVVRSVTGAHDGLHSWDSG